MSMISSLVSYWILSPVSNGHFLHKPFSQKVVMIALVVCTLVAIWARAEMFALVDYLVIVDIVSFYCPTVERSHPI